MHFTKLKFRNYRNFDSLDLELSPRVNVFLGKNGHGKSNLIESIHLLARGKPFRQTETGGLVKFGKSEGFIHGVFHDHLQISDLHMKISEGRSELFWDEKRITAKEASHRAPLVLFSPENLSSIKGSAEERRDLTDQALVLDSANTHDILSGYEKALKSRNRILKDLSEGLQDPQTSVHLLEALNPIFIGAAVELTWLRLELLKRLSPLLQDALNRMQGRSMDFQFDYRISDESAWSLGRSDIQHLLEKRLNELREAEASRGHSLVGPHKHDIVFLIEGRDSRYYASQGQQRSLILSFNIAQIVHHHQNHGKYPLLLLDDVLSELDQEKRFFLVRFLKELDTQTLVTSTELSSFEDLKGVGLSSFRIEAGQVSLINA